MRALEHAVHRLREAVSAAPVEGEDPSATAEWRWRLRGALAEVGQALGEPGVRREEAWLAAREGCALRRGQRIRAQVTALAHGLVERGEVAVVRSQARRLLVDLEHHVQRTHDLAWDDVELELGVGD